MKTYTEPPHYCVLTLTIYVLTTFFLPSLSSQTHLYDPVIISASFPFLILAEPSVLQNVVRSSHYLPFLTMMILVAFPNPSSTIAIHHPPLSFFWAIAS